MGKWLLGAAGVGTVVLAAGAGEAAEDGSSGTGGGAGGEGRGGVEPYNEYARGPYTIDLTALATGIRWRVYATSEHPATEDEKDAVMFGAGTEASDADARVAANAFADALGVLPVEPYPLPPLPHPLPPKPQPDPPGGEAGLDGLVPPDAGAS
jgi:hypothetical protein